MEVPNPIPVNSGIVYDIEILNDGSQKILIAGSITLYNATSIVGIARINTDGSLDNTFNSYFVTGATFSTLRDTDVFEGGSYDGKIVCGGAFTQYSGQSRNGIVILNFRWDFIYNI